MVRRSDVSATRQHNGSWEVAAMVNGHRESRVYYDATRDEAIDEFREEMDRLYSPSKVKASTAGNFLNDPEDVQWLKDVHLKGPLAKSFRDEVKSFVLFGNEDAPDKVHIYATKDPTVDSRYYIVRFNERGNIRDVSGAGGRKKNPDLHSVKQIASNMTEAIHGTATILYSYQTPVAVHVEGIGYFRTAEKFSVTTSKHINKWLESHGARGATVVPQDEIVKLAKKGGQGAGDVRGTTTSYTHPPRASNPKSTALAGYLKSLRYGEELTDFHGKGLGWKYDSTISNFRNRHSERQYAITLVKGTGKRKQYAGGLYLGDSGSLFRGEVFGILSWPTAENEASNMAMSEAEHWLQVDAEDEERADQEGGDEEE